MANENKTHTHTQAVREKEQRHPNSGGRVETKKKHTHTTFAPTNEQCKFISKPYILFYRDICIGFDFVNEHAVRVHLRGSVF